MREGQFHSIYSSNPFREFVRDKFEFYRNYKCTFVLCFAPGKRDAKPGDIHQVLKYCEQQYSEQMPLPSIHCTCPNCLPQFEMC